MANTYTKILYHVVFSTKGRRPSIHQQRREDLYQYVWGIHKRLRCHLYRIGGVEDHVHILTSIPPTLALSKYIENVKVGSTNWIRRENVFARWPGWQDGYSAFSVSWSERDALIKYIKGQGERHRRESFSDELRLLLRQAGVEFDERYLV